MPTMKKTDPLYNFLYGVCQVIDGKKETQTERFTREWNALSPENKKVARERGERIHSVIRGERKS